MKTIKLLTLSLLGLVLTSCSQKKETEFSVMTWNIWHGGLHGSSANNFEKDSANTVNVLKVLQEENADILFMQETYCCGMELAVEAGYPYSLRGSSNLSIHSKYPIVDTIDLFQPFNSHAAVIDIKGKQILAVNIWLHYLPDTFQDIKTMSPKELIESEQPTRVREIKAILKEVDSLQQHMGLPVVIGGDFNSASHLDWVESTRDQHYGKVVKWPVSSIMHDNGFIDSFREVHPDPVNTLQGTWGYFGDDIISDRIDYIYHRGEGFTTTASKIVMDDPEGGFFNSDHRAIKSEFSL